DGEIVDGELVGAWPIFGGRPVHALARPQQLIDAALNRQIEVRDRLLGQGKALGNDPAHTIVRDDVVGARIIERPDLVVGHRRDRRRAGRRHLCHRPTHRRSRLAILERRIDVATDHAPVRTRAIEPREVEAVLGGEPTCQRRCQDPAFAGGFDNVRRRCCRRRRGGGAPRFAGPGGGRRRGGGGGGGGTPPPPPPPA